MNYATIKNCDIANGPGVRVSLFVSGCTHRCPGCFNEVAWDFDYGQPFTQETIDMILDMDNGDCYMTIPELTKTYVALSMTDAGMDMSQLENAREMMAEMVEKMPSEEKLNSCLLKYWAIVLANVEDVEKSTETVEVDGLEQKLNVITFTVTDENLVNIAIAILEDIQEDEELLEWLTGRQDTPFDRE